MELEREMTQPVVQLDAMNSDTNGTLTLGMTFIQMVGLRK
jgi:hypothetical protein